MERAGEKKDKDSTGAKEADKKIEGGWIERRRETERLLPAAASYQYSSPVSHSRNSVSRTINTLLSRCLSRRTLPFASI